MSTSYEKISKNNASSQGKTDSNLSNDSNHLGGVSAEDYATKKYVQDYHDNKEQKQKEYIDEQDAKILEKAKEHANSLVRNQDFSGFAKNTDIKALETKLSNEISTGLAGQQTYTDNKVQGVVDDVNNNFESVNTAIKNLNTNQKELFQSVSDGKKKIAGAITDKGVTTSANDTFETMATNIRNIPNSGSGEIPEGYVNTSDATAQDIDILSGKTAYVNGKKVYGKFTYTGDNSKGEYNPSAPYPTTGEVEIVYAPKENVVQVNRIGINKYNVFDISNDGRILIGYNEEEKTIETTARYGDSFVGYECKKNTFEDLGIEENENYILSDIKFSSMFEGGYECRVAILFKKATTDESLNNVLCYVYKFNTGSEKFITDNQNVEIGSDGNTTTYTRYSTWKIESKDKSTKNISDARLIWSPYSYTLAITYYQEGRYIEIYRFRDFLGASFDASKTIDLRDSFAFGGSLWGAGLAKFSFVNMDRLVVIEWTNSYGVTHSEWIYKVYDENFTPIRTISAPKSFYAITNDGLYALADGANSLYALTIDYEGNKDMSATKICDTNIGTANYKGSNIFFSQDDKYLIVYGTVMWVFAVDLEKQTFTKIYESTYEDYKIIPLSNYKSFITKSGSQNYLIETIPDGKTIIGVRYQGETFYRYITHPGRFSAQQSDVRVRKTFIGYNGIPQTGTAEDLEVTQ